MAISIINRILSASLARTPLGRSLSDKTYLSVLYKIRMGRRLDWQNPKSFTEKIQWLKFNLRDDLMTMCADKYAVRNFVEKRVGPQILKKLYGVYDKPEEIDLTGLPEAFVLKVNHGSKQNIFCKKKSELDWKRTARRLKKYLKANLYPVYREWSYKNIVPRIVCEEYLAVHGEALYEYGFYCYDGIPTLVEINEYRSGEHRVNFFDRDLTLLENKYSSPPLSTPVVKTPEYERMLEYAALLSKGFPFVRADLYLVNKRICFGEMTFYPLAGLAKINPESFDYFLGSFLKIVPRSAALRG